MAALFQIRRGSGSVNLNAGELYNNQTSRSLQMGIVDSGSITLAKLNETNIGNFDITGNLIVSGNTTIVGNLQFGSTSSIQDTVTLLSEVSSSIIPYNDLTWSLGTTTKRWNNIYANVISASAFTGSFAGIGNLEIFSQSVDSRLDYLEGPLSTSVDLRLDRMEASSSLYDNAMSGSNRLYVSPSGSDSNDGKDPSTPFKTIKAAVESLDSAIASNRKPYTIYVGSGNYTEQNPIAVPPGVAIVGDTLRTVRLTAANPTKDFFHTHDANYFYGLRFLDLQYPAFAFSFPSSTATGSISAGGVSSIGVVHSLSGYTNGNNQDLGIIIEGPDNSGSAATATANVSGGIITQINVLSGGNNYTTTDKPHISIPAPSAQRPVITTSPYVQNCSSITGPFDTSGNKVYRALPYDFSDIDEQGAGGGIRIDGNLVSGSSPLESFVADAFTQVNQGGPGHLVINKGYAQFVSCFTTFCTYGFKVANGGFANISNSVIDFGKYGLISKRYFPTTYNSGSSLETKTSTVSGFIIDENGAGYTGSVASVTISGGTLGTQATAQANVNANGSIDEIILLTSGSGYTFEPTVTIAAPTGPGAQQATTVGGKANISGITEILITLNQDALRGVDISSNMILSGSNYLVTGVSLPSGSSSPLRRVTTYPAPPFITTGDGLAFHQLSNISTGGLVMEYVGSGVTYNALPKYGGVPIRTREVNEFVPGKVFYTTVDNIGNLKIGQFFAVNQLTGEVTINANSFNLSGLNAIGPFKRNGVVVGAVLQEVSNNTTLLNSQGLYGEDTVPTQYAVKGYIDVISASFDSRTDKLEATASNHKTRIDNLESISSSYNSYTQSINTFTSSVTQSLDAIHSYTSSLKNALTASGLNVTIYGNLTVQGTQTAIESTTLNVKDINITLASGSTNSAAANGAGINIDGANVTMSWSDANQRIELNKDFAVTGSISSSTLVGVGNVTLFSASVSASIGNLNNTSASLYNFSASQYNSDSSSFNTRITANSASAWGAFQSASSYSGSLATTISASKAEYTSFSSSNASTDNTQTTNITAASASAWGAFQSASTYSGSFYTTINNTTSSVANISTSVGLLQTFSSSQYNSDSSSFNTRISASTLTFNDTTGQTAIDFTQVGTQVSAIASGLTTGSSVKFSSITASYVSASGTIYADTIVYNTLVGSGGPVLEYETNGTLGNILIKGATSKSIQVVDSIKFTGLAQNGGDQYSATGLQLTGSLHVTQDITASGNLYVSGTIYAYELHTIIESSSIIRTSGSTFIGDAQNDVLTITGSLLQTGSTSFSELTGSLASFSSSLNTRFNTATASLEIISASAWGAFQSASSYSASANLKYALLSGSNQFNGNQTITGSLYVTADVTAYYSSDERLKDNIQLISNPIQKIEQLRGVEFDWKNGMPKAGQHDYGVIAQDVLKVMPELVNQRQDGYYAVDYDKIIGLLIEVVKEQEKRIKNLENK